MSYEDDSKMMSVSCPRNRIVWVDILRGFCMLAILWFHTEFYYAGEDIIPYAMYVGDILAVFFFLSGYVTRYNIDSNYRKMLYSVLRWLVVPYLVFTSLIALPKALLYHSFSGIVPIITHILIGQASWFVCALIVSKLIYIVILRLLKPSIRTLSYSAIVSLLLSAIVGNSLSPWHNAVDFWCVNEALLGYSLTIGGIIFRRYEHHIVRYVFNIWGILTLTALLFVAKFLIISINGQMVFGPLIVTDYPLFVADLLVAVLLIVGLFRRIPRWSFAEWVGRRSIVYYFLCGGCPVVISMLLRRFGFSYSHYLQIPIAYLLVVILATSLVYLIYRYTNIVRY